MLLEHPGGVARGSRAARDVIRDELLGTVLTARHHHALGDVLMPAQVVLDVTQLDPVSTDLHLEVQSAEVVDLAVLGPAGQVSGAVELAAGHEIVVDEILRGQVGTVHVAPGHSGTGDAQFTGLPGRHRPQPLVEDVDPGAGDRPADGGRGVEANTSARGVDGGLRRPVQVPRFAAGVAEVLLQRPGQCLAAAEDPYALVIPPAGVEEHAPGRGRGLHDGGPHRCDALLEALDVLDRRAVADIATGTADQRQEQLDLRHVETDGGDGEEGVRRTHAGLPPHRAQQITEAPVGDHHALGPAVAGGVDDVGEVVPGHLDPPRPLGRGGGRYPLPLFVEHQQRGRHRVGATGARAAVGQVPGAVLVTCLGDDQGGAAVGDDVGQPGDGQLRIEGHEGRTRLEDPEQRDDHLGRPVEQERPPGRCRRTPRSTRYAARASLRRLSAS